MKSVLAVILSAVFAGVVVGCAGLIGPKVPGENLSLLQGAQSNNPAFIDGDVKTAGETSFPESSGSSIVGITPPSEAYVLFPDVYTISKVVIYSDELVGFDLYVENPTQGMKLINKYDGQKGPMIELPMKGIVRGSGIRVRIRRTVNDAATRQKNTRVGTLGGRYITGNTRATASISEIQVFGPPVAGRSAPTEATASTDTTAEIGAILMSDLAGTTGKTSGTTTRPAAGRAAVGQTAPTFILTMLTGAKLNLEDYIGNVLLINFWSPAAAGSAQESGILTDLRNELSIEDFEIIGISTSKDENAVAEFVRAHKVGYSITLTDGFVEGRYGVGEKLPTTFLIDRQGKIARQFVGPQARAALLLAIRTALQQPMQPQQ